jgi:mannosyl-oligosaccharide alpha-1,2-mannosidase
VSQTGHQHWNYGDGAGGSGAAGVVGAGYSLRGAPPPIPVAPPAPPAPPSRLAALPPGPPPSELPLRPDRPGAAAGGGAASASAWATVSADTHKRDAVRDAMRHAWSSYASHALGYDELQPAAKRGKNGFGGMGATVVDALDTLHIMGLTDEFAVARKWVESSLSFNRFFDASVFETTIRIIGGLMSAHHLTGDALFVEKAKELADRLMPAFETATGIPFSTVNLKSGKTRNAVRGACI